MSDDSSMHSRLSETLTLNLSEPELIGELRRAVDFFRDDVCEGIAQHSRGELASSDEVLSLERRLESTAALPSIDDQFFRNAICAAWGHAIQTELERGSNDLQDLLQKMCGSQLDSFLLICGDFDILTFDRERFDEIATLLESLIVQGECGKALKVVRSNAKFLGSRLSARYQARAWSRLSRIDRRFDAISDRYRQAAGIGGDILFKADRPAQLSARATRRTLEQADHDFCAEVTSAIHDHQSNPALATDDEVARLENKLKSVYGMKHFDDDVFRSYLLEGWLHVGGGEPSNDAMHEVELWETLSESQRRVADELLADFCSLLGDHLDGQTLTEKVRSLIAKGRTHEALRWIRDAEHSSSVSLRSSLYAEVWNALSKFVSEPRFSEIAKSYERWSELCSWDEAVASSSD